MQGAIAGVISNGDLTQTKTKQIIKKHLTVGSKTGLSEKASNYSLNIYNLQK